MRFAFAVGCVFGLLIFLGVAFANETPAPEEPRVLRVLTLNLNALPAPLKFDIAPLMEKIAEILRTRREAGTHPQLVFLQEAFDRDATIVAEKSGYPFALRGPGANLTSAWPPTLTGSGLKVLSDFPIDAWKVEAFGSRACAGFDCLANKAVLWARIIVPGLESPLNVVTTHMNSHYSAGGPTRWRTRAHAAQTDILARFLDRVVDPGAPLVFAGDTNTRFLPRRHYFERRIMALDAMEACRALVGLCQVGSTSTPTELAHDANDKQYFLPGSTVSLQPVFATRNFRETVDGRPLSDHRGYEVHYGLGNLRLGEIGPIAAPGSWFSMLTSVSFSLSESGIGPAALTVGCPSASETNVLVTVRGFKDRKGNLRIELYSDKEDEFIVENLGRVEVPTPGGEPTLCLPVPSPGTYTVGVLHDRNENGRLNVFSDGYGFSNNPKLGWSKPDVKKAVISVGPGTSAIIVILNYFRRGTARPL